MTMTKTLMALGAALLLLPAASAQTQAGSLGPCQDQLIAESQSAGSIDEHVTALVNFVNCLTLADAESSSPAVVPGPADLAVRTL